MRKDHIKRITSAAVSSVLAVTLVAGLVPQNAGRVEAARSVQEIQNDKNAIDSSLNTANSQLVSLLTDVQDLNNQIASKQQEISDTEVNLEAAQKSVEKQKAAIKERMKNSYESDASTNMLSVILDSRSIADFLNRVDYVTQVYQYDKNQLDTYQETVDATKSYQKELEDAKSTLETKQNQLSAKQTELNSTISSLQAQKGNIDAELQAAKEEAARKAAEEAKAREEAQRKANEEASRKAAAAAAAAAAQKKSQEEAQKAAAAAAAAEQAKSNNKKKDDSGLTPKPETPKKSNSSDNANPSSSVNGSAVVAYAMQFVGNPYVWGGTSLTNGCDCSGFVSSVFQHFGKLNSRYTSGSFQGVGKAVSIDNMQPGDIICYSGHVAIYAGGGKIVEAQSTKAGITCNRSVYSKPILAVRRL
ncbi:MAG: NlpC/P60 family protein [Lachnospiraceae bacterium]|nr:NlpC/P60 family protein [Lachnospiraceae bacterium]